MRPGPRVPFKPKRHLFVDAHSSIGIKVVLRNNKYHAVLGSSSAVRTIDLNVPDPWDKSFDVEVCQLPNARIEPQQC